MNIPAQFSEGINPEKAVRAFNLLEYVNFLWRQWPFIGVITILAFVFAGVYLGRVTPLYTASAQVLLQPQNQAVPGVTAAQAELQIDDTTQIENQIAIIKSDALLKRVVASEGLAPPAAPATTKSANDWSLRSFIASLFGEAHGSQTISQEDPGAAQQRAIQSAVNKLRSSVMVSRVGQGHVLSIGATALEPESAAATANAIADAYMVDKVQTRYEAAKTSSSWLGNRLTELRQLLHELEEAVAQFRMQNNLVRSGPTATMNEQQLADLNSKLIAAQADTAEKRTRVQFLTDIMSGKKSILALPDTMIDKDQATTLASLRQKLTDVSQSEAQLLSRYDPRHPALAAVVADKRDLQQAIQSQAEQIVSSVKSDYALAQTRQAALEQALGQATGQGGLDSQAAIKLRELERTAAVNKTLFEDFLKQAKLSEEVTTVDTRDVRILTPAQPPTAPSSPNVTRVLTVALILGLGCGVGLATAMELLHVGFTTPREIEDRLQVPVLATVSTLGARQRLINGKQVAIPYVQIEKPLSRFSEAIRTLRTGIQMSDVDHPPKIIQVTSAKPDEGKTTVSLSVALSSGSSKIKTLIIDADLRHSSVTEFFNLRSKMGLADLLMGSVELADAVQIDEKVGLHIIPAGTKSLNPPDLLGSERMVALLASLRETYDCIVIDSPPLGPVVDASIIARFCDKTLFVIKWGSTPRDLVETHVHKLAANGRLCGIVLNYVNEGRARKYGRSYYYGSPYYAGYYKE